MAGARVRRTIKLKLVAELFNCRFDNADGEAGRGSEVATIYTSFIPRPLGPLFIFSLSLVRRLSSSSQRRRTPTTPGRFYEFSAPGSALIIKRRWWINFLQNLPWLRFSQPILRSAFLAPMILETPKTREKFRLIEQRVSFFFLRQRFTLYTESRVKTFIGSFRGFLPPWDNLICKRKARGEKLYTEKSIVDTLLYTSISIANSIHQSSRSIRKKKALDVSNIMKPPRSPNSFSPFRDQSRWRCPCFLFPVKKEEEEEKKKTRKRDTPTSSSNLMINEYRQRDERCSSLRIHPRPAIFFPLDTRLEPFSSMDRTDEAVRSFLNYRQPRLPGRFLRKIYRLISLEGGVANGRMERGSTYKIIVIFGKKICILKRVRERIVLIMGYDLMDRASLKMLFPPNPRGCFIQPFGPRIEGWKREGRRREDDSSH